MLVAVGAKHGHAPVILHLIAAAHGHWREQGGGNVSPDTWVPSWMPMLLPQVGVGQPRYPGSLLDTWVPS